MIASCDCGSPPTPLEWALLLSPFGRWGCSGSVILGQQGIPHLKGKQVKEGWGAGGWGLGWLEWSDVPLWFSVCQGSFLILRLQLFCIYYTLGACSVREMPWCIKQKWFSCECSLWAMVSEGIKGDPYLQRGHCRGWAMSVADGCRGVGQLKMLMARTGCGGSWQIKWQVRV